MYTYIINIFPEVNFNFTKILSLYSEHNKKMSLYIGSRHQSTTVSSCYMFFFKAGFTLISRQFVHARMRYFITTTNKHLFFHAIAKITITGIRYSLCFLLKYTNFMPVILVLSTHFWSHICIAHEVNSKMIFKYFLIEILKDSKLII
jgi:hypothetical protein